MPLQETLVKVATRETDYDPFIIEFQIVTNKGGAGAFFKKGEPLVDVINRLEELTHRLKRDVLERAKGGKL